MTNEPGRYRNDGFAAALMDALDDHKYGSFSIGDYEISVTLMKEFVEDAIAAMKVVERSGGGDDG